MGKLTEFEQKSLDLTTRVHRASYVLVVARDSEKLAHQRYRTAVDKARAAQDELKKVEDELHAHLYPDGRPRDLI
jgi:hypothetical protein